MEDDFVLVQYLNNINNVLNQAFNSLQRIKLVCFDASPSFLVFGTTSGGIYIFRRDPCVFLKLIPSKEGSANLIAISRDERHIGVASSRGLILLLENFVEDPGIQYQVFGEHEGQEITCIKWHRNELYVGDEKGKVSVLSVVFQSKSLFQTPTASLMTLDSAIVQIDAYQCYLLISSKTKTFLCNTEKENYVQIGKKLRDGYFGACFCNTPNDAGEVLIRQNARSAFQSVEENDVIVSDENANVKIYCARPGARLWEVGFDAKVFVTYQLKSALNEKPTDYLILGCAEESELDKRIYTENEKVPENFSFQKIFPICDSFILTYDADGLYIFNPALSKLVFWTTVSSRIKDVAFVNNNFYIWQNNLEMLLFSVMELEHLILATLYRKQYYICAEICVEFAPKVLQLLEESKKLYLVSALKSKIIDSDLLEKLKPILDKVRETNEKVFTRRHKGNIVLVENLYLGEEVYIPPQQTLVEDADKDLKLILKQYRLNKSHRTIEISEVMQLLETLSWKEMFEMFKRFTDYVKVELDDDATEWCQNQYLKHMSERNIAVNQLPNDYIEFLTKALIAVNEPVNFSCACGYPLPKCHKNPPNFYNMALDMFKSRSNTDKILKYVPYLWRHKIRTEVYGLNVTVMIQYSHLKLFKENSLQLTYDNWHDVLGYFVKIKKGLCLNCDRKIDIEYLLTWTQLARVIVQSLGAKNAVRILGKYDKAIPNGALDATFYQTCILAHSFVSDNSSGIKIKDDGPFKLVDGLERPDYKQFQECVVKYCRRKYLQSKNPCFTFSTNHVGACPRCALPLKSDVLLECETVESCGHRFHKFCFDRYDGMCNVCSS